MQDKSQERTTDLDILKIIFTDPVWLNEFKSQEISFIDLVADKLNEEDKKLFVTLVNTAMKQAADDIITNYDLDKQSGVVGIIINRLLPKNKEGERELGSGVWSSALGWFVTVSSMLPRKEETNRNIDRLFAMLYAGMHTFGRDVDNFKKVLVRGQNGSDKFLDETTSELPKNIGLKNKMSYAHGHFFDDAIFAAFFFDQSEGVDSIKEIYSSIKQCNYTSGISFVNKEGARAKFQDASNLTYLLESLCGQGIEEQDILIQMLIKAKERLATLKSKSFGYENDADKELRKATWQKLDNLYSENVCKTLYESRRLQNPWAEEELRELLEKSSNDLQSAKQLVTQKEDTVVEIRDKLNTFLTSFNAKNASAHERYELSDDIIDRITAKIAGLKTEQENILDRLNRKIISIVANAVPRGERKAALDELASIDKLEQQFEEFKSNFALYQRELDELNSARENFNQLKSEQEALAAKKISATVEASSAVALVNDKKTTDKPLVKNMYQTKLILLVGVVLIGLAIYSFIAGAAIATVLKIGLPGLVLSVAALISYTKRNCPIPPVATDLRSNTAASMSMTQGGQGQQRQNSNVPSATDTATLVAGVEV